MELAPNPEKELIVPRWFKKSLEKNWIMGSPRFSQKCLSTCQQFPDPVSG